MSYHWNWGILLSPVSTGEPTTYLGWLISGFWVTITVSLAAWVIALVVGSLFGMLAHGAEPNGRRPSARSTSRSSATSR